MIVTRFAPSPTGYLHIGGARTALFNWLFSRRHGGKFYLRIEDTDKERSTKPAIDAIFEGLKWLGLDWDGEVVYQSKREARHREVVQQLLDSGKAYRCYCSKEELEELRKKAMNEKRSFIYPRIWRDRSASEAPRGLDAVVRIKAPIEGKTVINDIVQGTVEVANETLDDFVILRSDGTPTYMLAVIVDDHDAGITHIIRGDDHLTNAFRQKIIYDALGWDVPLFAHIPLIHGSDGAKLSKRHGALGVEAYRDMGYMPEAMRNYLLRLGWSHGDDEIISTKQAISWFDLEHVGKSPARFDFDKLNFLNLHYLKQTDNAILVNEVLKRLNVDPENVQAQWIASGMESLKQRAKTLSELADNAKFYLNAPTEFTPKAQKDLADKGHTILMKLLMLFHTIQTWSAQTLEEAVKKFSEENQLKLGDVMAPVRAAITGSHVSPSMFEVMGIIGKQETIRRITRIK